MHFLAIVLDKQFKSGSFIILGLDVLIFFAINHL